MTRNLSIVVAAVWLVGLAISPSAVAVGLQSQRAVSAPPRSSGKLIAPPAACPSQTSLDAAADVQERAMLCMTEYARSKAGLQELAGSSELGQSARDKSLDILRCDSFSHFACGREFTYWMQFCSDTRGGFFWYKHAHT